MNKNYGKLKSIMFSIALAVGMLLPASSFAQGVEAETGGGLLGLGKLFDSDGQLFGRNRDGITTEEDEFSIEDFEDVPLGSGIAILIGAGLGYMALKKKEDEQ